LLKNFGPLEMLIVGGIFLLIFGVGRLGKLGKELGTGISEFRKGLKDGEDEAAADGAEENKS